MESQLFPTPPPPTAARVICKHTEAGGALLTPWALTGCGMGRALAGDLGDRELADCYVDPATSA